MLVWASGLVGWGWSGRGLCMRVWGWWVGVGQWWFVLLGSGLVGWGWSVVVCAWRVWGWWVEIGQWWVVHLGLGLVGWGWLVAWFVLRRFEAGGLGLVSGGVVRFGLGLVGWGWSGVVCA